MAARSSILALLFLVGCGAALTVEEYVEVSRIAFRPPIAHVVMRGDTLAALAKHYNVPVDDLRDWNQVDGDMIEVGQRLLVWPIDETAVQVATAPAASSTKKRSSSRSSTGGKGGGKTASAAPPAPVVIVPVMKIELPPPPPMVRSSGVLGALNDDEDLALAFAGEGLNDELTDGLGSLGAPRSASIGATGIDRRGSSEFRSSVDNVGELRGGGSGPPPDAGRSAGSTSSRIYAPKLAKPAAKACLRGPTGAGLGENDVAMSQGLSIDQVRRATSAFVKHTLGCIPVDSGSASITTEITVGCDGRVTDVSVSESGDLSDASVKCIVDTMYYAPFPAHDMPDGFTFGFPMRYSR